MRYTIRRVPAELDAALRVKATREGKSLNQVVLDVLMSSVDRSEMRRPRRDISFLVGSWDADPEVERALEEQRVIDSEMRLLWLVEDVRQRRVGLAKAAELAGIPLTEFLDVMATHQVSAFDLGPAELADELA